uniref:Uncharacterized protein n=1 Tax=Amphiprion percula TaxID=161767 RepID=A0A3P8SX42_AMPPE
MCCSRWQWLHGSADQTVEAFERALGSTLQLDELHTLWMDYLLFSCSPQASDPARSRRFSDLVQRCLSTVPTRLQVPFNPAEFWSCYRFHNKARVVSLYLSCLPPSQHALVLERLRYAMPNNTELGLRYGLHSGVVVSTFTLQLEDPWFTSRLSRDLSAWSLHVLPVHAWVFSGYSGFLPQSKNMLRLIDHSKLPVGVNVRVIVCLCM